MSENNTVPPVSIHVDPELQDKARSLAGRAVAKGHQFKNYVVANPGEAAMIAGTVAFLVVGWRIGRVNKAEAAQNAVVLDTPREMLEELALYPDLMSVFDTPVGQFKLQYVIPGTATS